MSFIKVKERRPSGKRILWTNRIIPSSSIDNIESDPEGMTIISLDNGHQIEVAESVDFIFRQITNPRISYIVDSEREVLAPESDCFIQSSDNKIQWNIGEVAKDITSYPEFRVVAKLNKSLAIEWIISKGFGNKVTSINADKFIIIEKCGIGATESESFVESTLAIAFNGENWLLYQTLRR